MGKVASAARRADAVALPVAADSRLAEQFGLHPVALARRARRRVQLLLAVREDAVDALRAAPPRHKVGAEPRLVPRMRRRRVVHRSSAVAAFVLLAKARLPFRVPPRRAVDIGGAAVVVATVGARREVLTPLPLPDALGSIHRFVPLAPIHVGHQLVSTVREGAAVAVAARAALLKEAAEPRPRRILAVVAEPIAEVGSAVVAAAPSAAAERTGRRRGQRRRWRGGASADCRPIATRGARLGQARHAAAPNLALAPSKLEDACGEGTLADQQRVVGGAPGRAARRGARRNKLGGRRAERRRRRRRRGRERGRVGIGRRRRRRRRRLLARARGGRR